MGIHGLEVALVVRGGLRIGHALHLFVKSREGSGCRTIAVERIGRSRDEGNWTRDAQIS